MDAHEVLDRMAHAYATCRTYRDRGVVTWEYHNPTGEPGSTRTTFCTRFARPARLRFEFLEPRGSGAGQDIHYIVAANGREVDEWWSLQRPRELALWDALAKQFGAHPLSYSIAGATGVSHGCAHTVPRLLLPDIVGGRCVTEMEDPSLGAMERVDGADCYVVTGGVLPGMAWQRESLWIDGGTWLLRRLRTQPSEEMAFLGIDITTYEPLFDSEVPDEEFRQWPAQLA